MYKRCIKEAVDKQGYSLWQPPEVALVHTDLDRETEEVIADTLQVWRDDWHRFNRTRWPKKGSWWICVALGSFRFSLLMPMSCWFILSGFIFDCASHSSLTQAQIGGSEWLMNVSNVRERELESLQVQSASHDDCVLLATAIGHSFLPFR